MARSHFSHHWYRVAGLKLSLRNHVEIHRQNMRGRAWFIIQDAQSGKYFRISGATRAILLRMDGRETIDSIWKEEGKKLGKSQPTQDETVELIAQLYRADLIRGDIPPNLAEFIHRSENVDKQQLLMRYKNPLALRFPLWDPDRFLDRLLPYFRIVFSRWGFIAWLSVIIIAIILAVMNWESLTSDLSDRVLSAENIALLFVLYPLIKIFHELGHGMAVKSWNGEVHEMGIMMLVFMPVPYVDASSSTAFQNRWQRALVGAVGIFVESFLAAIALFVWLSAEPGMVRAAAFNVMLIGGVSTVLFNGNPLLRFDGYYVLADLLSIPNLGTRSNKYLFYLVQKFAFKVPDLDDPAHSRGEAAWFVIYGLSSFVYRMVIMIAIALFVATKFFFIGVLIAGYAVFNALIQPCFKGFRYLTTSPSLGYQRGRAQLASILALVIMAGFLFLIPFPHTTSSEGIIYLDDKSRVISAAPGFIDEIPYSSGSKVTAGDILVILQDPQLNAQVTLLELQQQEYRASYQAVNLIDRVQGELLREQLTRNEATLAFYRERQASMKIKAADDGIFIVGNAGDLPGRYIRAGDVLGYVLPKEVRKVRVVVSQSRVSLVSQDTKKIEVRQQGNISDVINGSITQEMPSVIKTLPSPVLATEGGGKVAVNPQKKGLEPLSNHYQFDLQLERPLPVPMVDGRVFVRFSHSSKPLGFQWYMAARQVFLSILNV